MSRWENWLRIRHDPDTPPDEYQVALARKVLGELMEDVARGGLFQNKLTRRFGDGTVVTAQFDGTTPIVEVRDPQPQVSPLIYGCQPLKGNVSAPRPFAHPEFLFPKWPDTDSVPSSSLTSFEGAIYSFGSPNKLLRYDVRRNAVTAIPVDLSGGPGDFGALGYPYLFRAQNGKVHFTLCDPPFRMLYEYEIGSGWVRQVQTGLATNAAIESVGQPALENSLYPKWGRADDMPMALRFSQTQGYGTLWSASSYDVVGRKLSPAVAFAGDTKPYQGTDLKATLGRVDDRVVVHSAPTAIGPYYNTSTQQYDFPAKTPLFTVNLKTGVSDVKHIPLRFCEAAWAQICSKAYLAGAYVRPRGYTIPGPAIDHFDFQLLPEYRQLVEVDLLSGAVRNIGSLPFSRDDAELLYNQGASTYCVALMRSLLVFYLNLERNDVYEYDWNHNHYDVTGVGYVEIT